MSARKNLLVLLLAVVSVTAFAQQGKQPAKGKLPPLTTQLGSRSGTVDIAIDEALQLIKFPLKIVDDKKTAYSLVSYQFLYRKREITEDETTGKTSPTSSIVAEHFTASPLPEIWKTTIADRLKDGEELYFYDIVVKDASGKLMFAPTLKLKVIKTL
jgi:hypothetical protein